MVEQAVFTTGGTVQAGSGTYLTRKADSELLKLCREGAFAYVLTTRQMGKSSLMIRTAERLIAEGTRVALIDLTALGTILSPEQWYLGLLEEVCHQLELEIDLAQWWRERARMGSAYRMFTFFSEVLLARVQERLVLFVDEIDSTRGLGFTDDFFAAIRALYNARAGRESLRRLSVVLLGVATPSDLIQSAVRTPFNLGHRVDLSDFTYEEVLPLGAGLRVPEEQARQVLRWVMEWTGGHPYLTQRLCREMARDGARATKEDVDRAVARLFLGEQSFKDNNLQFARDMLRRDDWAPDVGDVLRAYRQVLLERTVKDEEHSPIKAHLKLAGVVRREGDALVVRNRIYQAVFNEQWVREHLPFSWRRFAQRLALPLVVLGFALLVPATVLLWRRAAEAEANAKATEATRREALFALEETRRLLRLETEERRAESEKYLQVQASAEEAFRQVKIAAGEHDQRELALAKLNELQLLHQSQMTAERARCDRAMAERDAALADAGVKQGEGERQLQASREDLQNARKDLQACSQRAEAAGSLLQQTYRRLAYPRTPEAHLTELAEKRDRLVAFIKAPSYVTLSVTPCDSRLAVDAYQLNDLARSAVVVGLSGGYTDTATASALNLPGGASAVADAARSGVALHAIQGQKGKYFVSYLDRSLFRAELLDLDKSGQTLDLTAEPSGRTPRCP